MGWTCLGKRGFCRSCGWSGTRWEGSFNNWGWSLDSVSLVRWLIAEWLMRRAPLSKGSSSWSTCSWGGTWGQGSFNNWGWSLDNVSLVRWLIAKRLIWRTSLCKGSFGRDWSWSGTRWEGLLYNWGWSLDSVSLVRWLIAEWLMRRAPLSKGSSSWSFSWGSSFCTWGWSSTCWEGSIDNGCRWPHWVSFRLGLVAQWLVRRAFIHGKEVTSMLVVVLSSGCPQKEGYGK